VDLGGTNLRAAAVDESGRMLEKISGSTPMIEGPDAVIGDIVDSVEKLRAKYGRDGLKGIGAGVPGNILMEEGVIASWPNMPSFNGYPVRGTL
jgi:glucokinase